MESEEFGEVTVYLANNRVIGRRAKKSLARAAVIRCLSCEKGQNGIYANQVSECSGLSTSNVSATLLRLEKSGLLITDSSNQSGPKLYEVADNEIGRGLREHLNAPEVCGLSLEGQTE